MLARNSLLGHLIGPGGGVLQLTIDLEQLLMPVLEDGHHGVEGFAQLHDRIGPGVLVHRATSAAAVFLLEGPLDFVAATGAVNLPTTPVRMVMIGGAVGFGALFGFPAGGHAFGKEPARKIILGDDIIHEVPDLGRGLRQIEVHALQFRFRFLQFPFGLFVFRDIAEVPDPALGFSVEDLGLGIAFEDPSILEPDRIETFILRRGVQLFDFSQEFVGIVQLFQNMPEE
jgi:hypothetical protein